MTRLRIIRVLYKIIDVDVLINFINFAKLVDRHERIILDLDATLTQLNVFRMNK